jgi:hypothetical protein
VPEAILNPNLQNGESKNSTHKFINMFETKKQNTQAKIYVLLCQIFVIGIQFDFLISGMSVNTE